MTRLASLYRVTRRQGPCRHQSTAAVTATESILRPAQADIQTSRTLNWTSAKRTPSVYHDGQFHNPAEWGKDKTAFDRLWDITRWLKERNYFIPGKRPDPFKPLTYPHSHTFPAPYNQLHEVNLNEHLPVMQPDFATIDECGLHPSNRITHTWIGHATSLVQLGPLTILTDPWFSQRASAWQRVGPQRIRPPACEIQQLPALDLIIISHNHFDHCDYNSIVELSKKVALQEQLTGRACRWYVPLGLSNFLVRWGRVPHNRIHELDWWQTVEHKQYQSKESFRVTSVPANHWTSRLALTDTRKQLWMGAIVEANSRKYYFAGDTAYCPVFKEIGMHCGASSIDIASIPVGAYRPRQLLFDVHVDPSEAVKIHQEVRSKHSVGIHWGTVLLGDEFVMEPKIELERAAREAGMSDDEFVTRYHGETIVID